MVRTSESAYTYINPIIEKLVEILKLEKNQVNFLVTHSEIDIEHAKLVRNTALTNCKTQNDWDALARVMEMTLRQVVAIMDAVLKEYENSLKNTASPYYHLRNDSKLLAV